MNPSNNETGMQLPAPVVETAPANGETAETAPGAAEQAPVAERSPAAAQPPAVIPVAAPVQPGAQAATASQPASGTATADDGDLIEKEWVNKAKQIVERTKDDPYKQSEGLTLVKADYMRQRYGKTLKISS